MELIHNKKGIGIAAVLGIVTFVLALVSTLFAVTVNQATMIKKSQDNIELTANYTHNLISASAIIENDPTILEDALKRTALSNLLNITFEKPVDFDYWILKNNDLDQGLTSYISYLPPGSGGYVEFDGLLISATDFENLVLGIYSIPHDFHISAASAFYNEFFFNLTGINPALSTFVDIMTHANLNQSNPKIHYQNSNYKISSNTVIPSDEILVVNGSLEINRNFNGIAIVRDSVTVTRNGVFINGSIYSGGAFIGTNNTNYAYSKNSFIFADSFTTGGAQSGTNDPNPTYTLYTFSNALQFNSNKSFTGGFFTDIANDINVKNALITFRPLVTPLTLNDGVPLNLFIEISGSGGSLGEGQLLSTYPRKE